MKGMQLSMKCIRKVLEYRLDKQISANMTSGALKVSKGSVINILKRFKESALSWPLPCDISDSHLEKLLYPQKPKRQISIDDLPDISYLKKELARPHMTLQRLWEDYSSEHPNGLKRSAFYRHFSCNLPPELSMKIHHKGGDKIFVDYSGDGLEYVDLTSGEIIAVELFVCCWGASSYCYAEATHSQKQSDFVMSHRRAFEYFDCVSHAVVPDNLKSAVIKHNKYNPLINRLYSLLCEHYDTAVLPARPRKPKDKAVVESNVLHIQRLILARLRNRQFFSLFEINSAIREELDLFNARPMKDYENQSRKYRFETIDKPYAKALPAVPFCVTIVKENVRVAKDYHISFDKRFYSVPWKYVGHRVEVRNNDNQIEIYHDHQLLCSHSASLQKFSYTTETKHMPKQHQFVSGWTPAYFLDQARVIGISTMKVIELTMNRKYHREQGFKAAMGVLRMAKQFTPERLENACKRALLFNNFHCSSIKSILDKGLDNQPLVYSSKSEVPISHENIRGAKQYESE